MYIKLYDLHIVFLPAVKAAFVLSLLSSNAFASSAYNRRTY